MRRRTRSTAAGGPSRRGREAASDRPRRGFERFLLSVMGPPSVGDVHEPSRYQPDPEAELCTTCRRPYSLHGRVHANITYLTCPT